MVDDPNFLSIYIQHFMMHLSTRFRFPNRLAASLESFVCSAGFIKLFTFGGPRFSFLHFKKKTNYPVALGIVIPILAVVSCNGSWLSRVWCRELSSLWSVWVGVVMVGLWRMVI